MFGAGHIDILSALVGGAVIGAIWLAFYLATDDDWQAALLADPDGETGLETHVPEALSRSTGTVGGGGSEAKADRLDTQHDSGTRTVAARGPSK